MILVGSQVSLSICIGIGIKKKKKRRNMIITKSFKLISNSNIHFGKRRCSVRFSMVFEFDILFRMEEMRVVGVFETQIRIVLNPAKA